MTVEQAAWGVHQIVNENMANAARVQAVERGHDLTGSTMVAFGGAGPVHSWGVATRLSANRIVVPPIAGLGSALGLLLAPRSYRISRTFIGTLDALDWSGVEGIFGQMLHEASSALQEAGVGVDQARFIRQADMRYLGQRKEMTIELPAARLGAEMVATLRQAFEEQYRRIYHRIHDGHPIEALSWHLTATGPEIMEPHNLRAQRSEAVVATAPHRRAIVFAADMPTEECRVYRRHDLGAGIRVEGPCVIEEDESTIVVGPGGSAASDDYGNLIVQLPLEGGSHVG